SSMTAGEATGPTLLIVEDNEITRAGLATVLQREGYSVVTAQDGKEALESLVHGPTPDLILLDMLLPGVDGWQFLNRRRPDPALASVPVVITTALGIASPEWATSLGATGLLQKPIDTGPLLREVRRCLAQ